jgi:uncharacterized protein
MHRLGLFAKPPVPGGVKTRLSPALPPALACALHAGLLRDALATLAASEADERVVWWASEPDPATAAWRPAGARAALQRDGDLGARLAHAFAVMLAAPGDRAVVVGSDAPALDAALVRAAFDALADHDVALAPARDGGYSLIALAAPAPALFEGVAWSTAHVFGDTLARAAAAGLRTATLAPLDDLDTPGDLVRWLPAALAAPPEHAPHARAALTAMGLLPARP